MANRIQQRRDQAPALHDLSALQPETMFVKPVVFSLQLNSTEMQLNLTCLLYTSPSPRD